MAFGGGGGGGTVLDELASGPASGSGALDVLGTGSAVLDALALVTGALGATVEVVSLVVFGAVTLGAIALALLEADAGGPASSAEDPSLSQPSTLILGSHAGAHADRSPSPTRTARG
jgi:hypothetical protein